MVTATKRGEASVLETPMSIQAITAEQLQIRGVSQFEDYARSISGLSFEDQGPGDKKIVLRGMTSSGAATAGLYFDDIVMTANNAQDGGGRQPDIRLVDMERIEVLKGPQGTLYGASSMSGTVRQITRKPDPSAFQAAFNGGLASTRGSNGADYNFDAMVNLPVSSTVGFRLVGYKAAQEGYIDDILLGRDGMNGYDVTGGRVAFRWQPSDDVALDLMYIRQDTDTDGPSWYQPNFGEFVQANHTLNPWDESLDALNAALSWTLSHGTVSASLSRMDREIVYRFDGTRVLCTLFGGSATDCRETLTSPLLQLRRGQSYQPQKRRITSSEVRYASDWDSRWQIVTGLFYAKESNDFVSQVQGLNEQFQLTQLIVNRVVQNDVEQKAAFGEISYDITDALTVTAGIRAFRIQIDQVGQNLVTATRPVAQPAVTTQSVERDETFKLNVKYEFPSGQMIYANYAEGFRSGGNNEPDFTTGTVLPPYGSDSLKSYEIGAKGRLFGDALELDVAAYRMDWSDLQARVSANIAGSSFLIIDNVGSAEIDGVEVGARLRPSRALDLTFGANATVLSAERTETTAGIGNAGDRLPNVPEFSASVYGEYGFPIGAWDSILRADYSYVGDSYSDFNSTRPVYTRLGDYSLVNLRWTFSRDRYRFAAYVQNLFDDLGWISSTIDARRPVEVFPTRPRTFGVTVGYSF